MGQIKNRRIDGRVGFPEKTGLYDPAFEKDSCGVGFVAQIKGQASRQIMLDAYQLNSRMDHRGGCGFEENTGDGAGILTAMPYSFFSQVAKESGIDLPGKHEFAVGNIFLPQQADELKFCKRVIERSISEAGLDFLGWREVPIDPEGSNIGPAAIQAMPSIWQLFVGCNDNDVLQFDRSLYIVRKQFSSELRSDPKLSQALMVYACSLSPKTIVYKGMLTPAQLFPFYNDLQDTRYETHLAMVHSRFSTNTFPSWDRAQPCRYMSHNGEINTLRGNVNQMKARQGIADSEFFRDSIEKLFPIAEPDCSDSGNFGIS